MLHGHVNIKIGHICPLPVGMSALYISYTAHMSFSFCLVVFHEPASTVSDVHSQNNDSGICVAGFSLPHRYHPNQPHRNSNTHRNKNTQPMW